LRIADTLEWSQPALITGRPAPRKEFAAAPIPGGKIIIHGGIGRSGVLDDAALFDQGQCACLRYYYRSHARTHALLVVVVLTSCALG
jgi:hypothetical protein